MENINNLKSSLLTDNDGNIVIPKTLAEAVFASFENLDGNIINASLDKILYEMSNSIDIIRNELSQSSVNAGITVCAATDITQFGYIKCDGSTKVIRYNEYPYIEGILAFSTDNFQILPEVTYRYLLTNSKLVYIDGFYYSIWLKTSSSTTIMKLNIDFDRKIIQMSSLTPDINLGRASTTNPTLCIIDNKLYYLGLYDDYMYIYLINTSTNTVTYIGRIGDDLYTTGRIYVTNNNIYYIYKYSDSVSTGRERYSYYVYAIDITSLRYTTIVPFTEVIIPSVTELSSVYLINSYDGYDILSFNTNNTTYKVYNDRTFEQITYIELYSYDYNIDNNTYIQGLSFTIINNKRVKILGIFDDKLHYSEDGNIVESLPVTNSSGLSLYSNRVHDNYIYFSSHNSIMYRLDLKTMILNPIIKSNINAFHNNNILFTVHPTNVICTYIDLNNITFDAPYIPTTLVSNNSVLLSGYNTYMKI